MDYNQEQFIRAQFETPKMPFYMSYPMQNMYLTEMEYEKDMDRMKELYPRSVKKILEYVEEECDKMEYEGSLMFDEYPDRLMLEGIANRIYKAVKAAEEPLAEDIVAEQYRGGQQSGGIGGPQPGGPQPGGLQPGGPQFVGPGGPQPGGPQPGGPQPGGPPPRDPMRDLIGVVLNNEMYRRRCRHRRCRRWW